MVYNEAHFVQFGYGDVNIALSTTGSRELPQAMLILQNQTPRETAVQKIEITEIISGEMDPENDFVMLFPDAKSIDIFISALQAVKEATFGEKNMVNEMMKKREELAKLKAHS